MWNDEKKKLKMRMLESDKTLVLLAREKESLERAKADSDMKFAEELERVKATYARQAEETENMHMRLNRTESTLSSMTKEKDTLEAERHALVTTLYERESTLSSMMKENDSLEADRHALVTTLCERTADSVSSAAPLSQIPRSAFEESELERMQAQFAQEKCELMERQAGLERMLKDALHAEDKENPRRSPVNNPKKTLQQLALAMKKSSPSPKPPMPQPLSSKALAPFSPRAYQSSNTPKARTRSPSPFKKNRSPSFNFEDVHPMDRSTTRTRIALDSPVRRREAPIDPE